MPALLLALALAASPLAQRGYVTDRGSAERAIAFRPFVPARAPRQVALLPPFHDPASDAARGISANDGIAYVYGRPGRSWMLSEWPRHGGSLAHFAAYPGLAQPHCPDVHAIAGETKPRGVVWTTPRGLVFSLVPTGAAEPRTIVTEWRRLVRAGACR